MLRLKLANGKLFLVGVAHIQAILSSGVGAGSVVILAGGVTYEVAQAPDEISELIDAYYAKSK